MWCLFGIHLLLNHFSIASGLYEEAILLRLQAIFGRYRPSYSQYSSVKNEFGSPSLL